MEKIEETDKEKRNRKWFIVFALLLLFSLITIIFNQSHTSILSPNYNQNYSTDICKQIQGTPAWVQNGVIIGYGERFYESYAKMSFQNPVKDFLIPNNITFVWDNKCSHCHNEINKWGNQSWFDYQKSNLTKECHIL